MIDINNFCIYFLLFLIYSSMGWLMEVIGEYMQTKRIVNRGFLVGPYCPIYGWGCIAMIILLSKYMNNYLVFFIMAILICSILEYFTSFFMEKIFHARWWDYSQRKFNINGRICLETMIPFGILGSIILYIVNPFFLNILNGIPTNILNTISIILLILFIADNIVSFNVIYKFKSTMKTVELDGTAEITQRVREVLMTKNWLFRRLIKAFPNLKNHKELLLELQRRIEKELKNLNNKVSETIDDVTKSIIK